MMQKTFFNLNCKDIVVSLNILFLVHLGLWTTPLSFLITKINGGKAITAKLYDHFMVQYASKDKDFGVELKSSKVTFNVKTLGLTDGTSSYSINSALSFVNGTSKNELVRLYLTLSYIH